jgi:Putative Actinobacterial Holin-X, holin superfamily III
LIRTWHDGAVTSARDNTNGDALPRVPSIPLTDEAAFDAAGNHSIGHLVKDATTQLSTLVRAEIELARSELAKEAKKAVTGSVFFIVALVVLLSSLPYLFITFALALNEALPAWAEPWGGFLIMFLVMLVVAVVFALLGRRKVKKIKTPERTITSLRDTTAALSRRSGEPGTEVSTDVAPSTPSRTS